MSVCHTHHKRGSKRWLTESTHGSPDHSVQTGHRDDRQHLLISLREHVRHTLSVQSPERSNTSILDLNSARFARYLKSVDERMTR